MTETRRRKRAETKPAAQEQGRIEMTPISEIMRWPRNPKEHDLDLIESSLRRFGFVEPLVFDERTGRLVAGHGRTETCERMIERDLAPPARVVVREDGQWLLPVVRGISFENESEAEAYVVVANSSVLAGGWDESKLVAILNDQRANATLAGTGFDSASLDAMLANLGADVASGLGTSESTARSNALEALATGDRGGRRRTITDSEEDADARAEAADAYYEKITAAKRTKLGDVWKLGDHVLTCGDIGIPATLDRVVTSKVDAVITDPPYAIFGSSTGISSSIADDAMVVPFFEMVVKSGAARTRLFGHMLFFCDWRSWSALIEAHRRATVPVKNMVVWDKGGGLGSMYALCHELVMFSVIDPPLTSVASRKMTGNRMVHAKNIVRVNRATGEDRPHNASKPIALVKQLVELHTLEGETVLDMFIGGGTTLLACELTGRKCIGTDKEPHWIDTVIARWEKMTDRKAELVSRVEG